MRKFLTIAIFVFWTGLIGAQTPVAVVESVIPKDWDQTAGEILTAKISESLVRSKEIRLIDRTNLNAVLKEQEFQLSGLVTDREAKLIGGLSGAQFIIVPRAARLGKTYFLSARMLNAATGEVRAQVSLEGTGEWDAFPGLAGQLAGKLGELFGVTLASSVTPRPAGPPQTPPVKPQGPAVTLKVWSIFDNPVMDLWIADFRQNHPEVNITWENLNFGKDNARHANFGLPGTAQIFIGPSDALVGRKNQGRILPLGPWVSERQFDQTALDAVKIENKIWALPLYIGNNLVAYYDKKIVTSVPRTLGEIQGLVVPTGVRKAAIDMTPGGFFYWPWLLGSTGGQWKSPNTAQLDKGLGLIKDLTKSYWPGWDYQTQVSNFEQRKVAYLIDGDWNLSRYRTALKQDLGVAPLPEIEPGVPARPVLTAFTAQLAKSSSPGEQAAAEEFLKYLSTPEAQKKLMVWAGLVPALATGDILESLYGDPSLTAIKTAQRYGVSYPATPGNFWTVLNKEVAGVLAGGRIPEAAQRLKNELQKIPLY